LRPFFEDLYIIDNGQNIQLKKKYKDGFVINKKLHLCCENEIDVFDDEFRIIESKDIEPYLMIKADEKFIYTLRYSSARYKLEICNGMVIDIGPKKCTFDVVCNGVIAIIFSDIRYDIERYYECEWLKTNTNKQTFYKVKLFDLRLHLGYKINKHPDKIICGPILVNSRTIKARRILFED